MKSTSKLRRFLVAAAMSLTAFVAANPTPVHAATGTVTGTVTAGGVPIPKGTMQVAFVQYPGNINCLANPTGQLVVAMVGANGTFSATVDTSYSWRVIFRPMTSAPRTALWRLYKAGNTAGVTRFYPDSTCLTVTPSGVTNVDLSTSETGIQVTGSLSTSTGAPVTEKATVYISRTATSYLSNGDGYVVKVGENGAWDISGVDQNQSNLYIQVNVGGTLYSVKKSGSQYEVITFDAACGDPCKFAIGSTDISGINLKLPPIGTISGTISGPSGPVGQGQVCAVAYKDGGSVMNMYSLEAARVCTDSNGQYTLGLTFGAYRLQFLNAPGAPFKTEWYNQVSSANGYPGANVITLAAGANASKTINATLAEGKYIRGTVTDSSGQPISGASVSAMLVNPETSMMTGVGGVNTISDGTFSLSGLDAGTYMLMANHPDYGMLYLGGSRDTATQISLSSNSAGSSGHLISFPRGYSVSGNLTTGDGLEARICVAAYRDNNSGFGWGDFIGSNCFTAPGPWKLKGLKAGSYRFRFDAQTGSLRSIFLGGSTDYNSASITEISASDISNIDVTIPSGKSISGKIMNTDPSAVQGACITAFKQGTWGYGEWSGGSCSGSNGEFTIRGLADGDYKLRIDPPMNSDYSPGFYSDSGSPVKSSDDALTLTLGNSISNLNQTLVRGPKFTATIIDASSNPVANVCMNAFKKVGSFGWGEWGGSSCSGIDGKINIRGLSTGEYTFEVRPNSGNFQNGWYVTGSATTQTQSSASPRTIGSVDVSLGNITLSSGNKASGRVINAEGNPVSGACIGALRDTVSGWGEWAGSSCTQSDGKFMIRGLDPAASYRFRVDIWTGDYKPGFINSANGVSTSIDGISASSASNDISLGDITLSTGPSISGTITSGADQAESGVCINAHDASTLMWKSSSCSQSSGKFSLRGLEPGTYKLSWWAQKPLLTNGWYKSTNSGPTQVTGPENADTITITSTGLSNLPIRLANGGKIFGTVTGLTSADICIAAWTAPSSGTRDNASAISCVTTEMKFELKGLTPNVDYYLQAFKKDGSSITQNSPNTDAPIQSGRASVAISVS
jgi:hypothetical protein